MPQLLEHKIDSHFAALTKKFESHELWEAKLFETIQERMQKADEILYELRARERVFLHRSSFMAYSFLAVTLLFLWTLLF